MDIEGDIDALMAQPSLNLTKKPLACFVLPGIVLY